MCKVSDQLRLCSCKATNVEKLKHYWILKRHDGGSNFILGEAILPADIGEDANKINVSTLAKMLNNGNCFDIEMQHQENDIMELHFTFHADPEKYDMLPCGRNYLAYAFVFKNNKWRKTVYDPFGANLQEIQKGKIVRPFKSAGKK